MKFIFSFMQNRVYIKSTQKMYLANSYKYVPQIPNFIEIYSGMLLTVNIIDCVRFEVFTAVTMKNVIFWDVTLCGSCKNRRFGGT
jgi:hypothetical protein